MRPSHRASPSSTHSMTSSSPEGREHTQSRSVSYTDCVYFPPDCPTADKAAPASIWRLWAIGGIGTYPSKDPEKLGIRNATRVRRYATRHPRTSGSWVAPTLWWSLCGRGRRLRPRRALREIFTATPRLVVDGLGADLGDPAVAYERAAERKRHSEIQEPSPPTCLVGRSARLFSTQSVLQGCPLPLLEVRAIRDFASQDTIGSRPIRPSRGPLSLLAPLLSK